MAIEPRRHRFTVEEYHRMAEARILTPGALRPRGDFYGRHHPEPDDIRLVVDDRPDGRA